MLLVICRMESCSMTLAARTPSPLFVKHKLSIQLFIPFFSILAFHSLLFIPCFSYLFFNPCFSYLVAHQAHHLWSINIQLSFSYLSVELHLPFCWAILIFQCKWIGSQQDWFKLISVPRPKSLNQSFHFIECWGRKKNCRTTNLCPHVL